MKQRTKLGLFVLVGLERGQRMEETNTICLAVKKKKVSTHERYCMLKKKRLIYLAVLRINLNNLAVLRIKKAVHQKHNKK